MKEEVDFILGTAALYLARTHPRRRFECLYRNSPAGPVRGFRQHGGAVARPYHPHQNSASSPSAVASGPPIAGWPDCVDQAATLAALDPGPAPRRNCASMATIRPPRNSATSAGMGLMPPRSGTCPRRSAAPRTSTRASDPRWRGSGRSSGDGPDGGRRPRPPHPGTLTQRAGRGRDGPGGGGLMATELGRDESWIRSQVAEFEEIAARYIPT